MVRLPLTIALTFTLVTLSACNGESDGPIESPPSTQSPAKSASPTMPTGGSGGTQAPAPSGSSSSSSSSSSGGTSGGKGGDPANPADPADPSQKDPGKQPQAADPACVQSCGANGGLKAKCQGDDTFCDDVCAAYTPTEITCLTSAPTCEKSEWIRCEGN